MSIERTCPRCGTALAPDALEGLCPKCVGRAVFADSATIAAAADGGEGALSAEVGSEALRLEIDHERRYKTANSLAKDIERHMASEAVNARLASQLQRHRRLARRNRVIFAAAGAVAAALAIGLGMATRSFLNEQAARAGETAQRKLAEERSSQAQTSAGEAKASELKARRFLYVADMNLVQQSLRMNRLGQARELLDRHRAGKGDLELRGWEWRYLWQQCRSGAQAILTKRDDVDVTSMSFSPDGHWLVVGYVDGQVELWDISKRKLERVVQEPIGRPAHVAFSPRGDSFTAAATRTLVKTHNIATGGELRLCNVEGSLSDISYSRDGELVAVLTDEPAVVQVLQAANAQPIMNYALPSGGGAHFNNVRLSRDKNWLYISFGAWGERENLRCVSVPDARARWELSIRRIEGPETKGEAEIGFTAMDLSPDGRTLAVATGYSDPGVRVLDAMTGQLIKRLEGHTGWVCDLAFSNDGRMLASASTDQTIQRWDTASWAQWSAPMRGHGDQVHSVTFTADGRTLASGSKDGEVLLWDTSVPRAANGRLDLPPHILTAIPLPGGRTVLCRTTGKWSLLDLHTLTEESLPAGYFPTEREYGPAGYPNMSALSTDGKLRAVAVEDGPVEISDPPSESKIGVLRRSLGGVNGLAFSPDSHRLALTCNGSQGIELWDLTTRQELLTLTARGTLLTSVEFTDDGNTLLIGSQGVGLVGGGTWQFWRVPSWAEIEETERSGGLWPQTEAFYPPGPIPPVSDSEHLLEWAYRKKLAEARAQPAKTSVGFRDKCLANLVELLRHAARFDDAEPLARELLESRQQRAPRNEALAIAATSTLANVLLSLAEKERLAGDLVKSEAHAREADGLITEQIAQFDADRRPFGYWEEDAVKYSAAKLIGTALSLADTARAEGDSVRAADRTRQADALGTAELTFLGKASVGLPKDLPRARRLAALQVWLGKHAEYLDTCRRMIQWAEENPDDSLAAESAAEACCLRRSSDPALLQRALVCARRAAELANHVPGLPWHDQVLGLAEFRAGNDAAAERALKGASEISERHEDRNTKDGLAIRCLTRLYRSMIFHGQGKKSEAYQLFAEAEALATTLSINDHQVFHNGATNSDVLVCLAYKEAKAVLK